MKVGDHVRDVDRDDGEEPLMVVVALTSARADEYEFSNGRTVADANPGHDAGEPVVEVVFPQGYMTDIEEATRYGYPASRLEVVPR
jgi:hypothetical protein